MVDWVSLIKAAEATEVTVTAHTFLKSWGSASRPVLLLCDDGGIDREYVVKGQHSGRQAVNDQIVARLGTAAAAPVGTPALVDVPAPLIAVEPEMQHIPAGVSHGCVWIPDCSERLTYEHAGALENKSRFGLLALLFGWAHANDHQFIYENDAPHLVYSVDHGHFFPSGPDWTEATLKGASTPTPDAAILGACGLSLSDLKPHFGAFSSIADDVIVSIVAGIPDAWGVSESERAAMAEYLSTRRDLLFPPEAKGDDQ